MARLPFMKTTTSSLFRYDSIRSRVCSLSAIDVSSFGSESESDCPTKLNKGPKV
jgi:hypothetical protein